MKKLVKIVITALAAVGVSDIYARYQAKKFDTVRPTFNVNGSNDSSGTN